MNKKGIYFTLVSVIILSILIGFTVFEDFSRMRQKTDVATKRADTMNEFLLDLYDDIDRAMLIAGFRSLLAVTKYMAQTQTYLSDAQSTFQEAFISGKINGSYQDLMNDSDIEHWALRINDIANEINVNFEGISNSLIIGQSDPWSVDFHLNITFILTDPSNIASWNVTKVFIKNIPILELEDPLYVIGTNDKMTNLIIQTNVTDFIPATNETDDLQVHLNNSLYFANVKAPSYIMRFGGNFSNSTFGIESMVNLDILGRQTSIEPDKSVIDYIYFDTSYSGFDKCNIEDMPTWFVIDSDHINTYEINVLNYTSC